MEPDAEIGTQLEYRRGERKGKGMSSDVATYPHLLVRTADLLFEAPPPPREAPSGTVERHLELASKNYLDVRKASTLLSVLIVPGTFLIALRFMSAGWALAAAALAGASMLGLGFAQQARPHAAEAAFTALALAAALRLRERGDTASWLLAALAAALAIGCLHSGLAVLVPVAAAHLLGRRERLLEPRALLVPLGAALSIALLYPFASSEQDGELGMAVRREGETLYVANHNLELDRFDGGGFLKVARTLWWYEPALLALLVLAAGVFVAERLRGRAPGPDPDGERDRGRAVLVVLSYAASYLLVIGIYGETFERFLLPVLPCFAVFAVWGASRLRRPLGALAAGGAVLGTLVLGGRLAWLRAQPDTLELAAAWIGEHVPLDEPLFLSPIPNFTFGDSSLELPLLRSDRALAGRGGPRLRYYNVWSKYQQRLPEGAALGPRYDAQWLIWSAKQAGVPEGVGALDYLAANPRSFFEQAGPGWYVIEDHLSRPENVTEILLQRGLEQYGERQARFSPDAPERDRGFPFTAQDRDEDGGDWPHVAWRVLTARRTGPAVEVWRVTEASLGAGR